MALCKGPGLLNELVLGNHVRERSGGKHGDHIEEMEFGVKVFGKIGRHF
jgi:hypothetical protein